MASYFLRLHRKASCTLAIGRLNPVSYDLLLETPWDRRGCRCERKVEEERRREKKVERCAPSVRRRRGARGKIIVRAALFTLRGPSPWLRGLAAAARSSVA
eukprot:scaffold283501_cov24-Tisochrysis_lutea.AAC.1